MTFTRPRVKKGDDYLAKIVKYIPAEIIATYVAASGVIEAAKGTIPFHNIQWVMGGILLALCPLYILKFTSVQGQPPPVYQAIVSAIAFACWVFALSNGPFSTFTWYSPAYGSLVLMLFTLVAPLFGP